MWYNIGKYISEDKIPSELKCYFIIHQEDTAILNTCLPINNISKYMNQNLM